MNIYLRISSLYFLQFQQMNSFVLFKAIQTADQVLSVGGLIQRAEAHVSVSPGNIRH